MLSQPELCGQWSFFGGVLCATAATDRPRNSSSNNQWYVYNNTGRSSGYPASQHRGGVPIATSEHADKRVAHGTSCALQRVYYRVVLRWTCGPTRPSNGAAPPACRPPERRPTAYPPLQCNAAKNLAFARRRPLGRVIVMRSYVHRG